MEDDQRSIASSENSYVVMQNELEEGEGAKHDDEEVKVEQQTQETEEEEAEKEERPAAIMMEQPNGIENNNNNENDVQRMDMMNAANEQEAQSSTSTAKRISSSVCDWQQQQHHSFDLSMMTSHYEYPSLGEQVQECMGHIGKLQKDMENLPIANDVLDAKIVKVESVLYKKMVEIHENIDKVKDSVTELEKQQTMAPAKPAAEQGMGICAADLEILIQRAVNQRLAPLQLELQKQNNRIEIMEQAREGTAGELESLAAKIGQIAANLNARMDGINREMGNHRVQLDDLNQKVDQIGNQVVEQQQQNELASTRFNIVTAELAERIRQLESELAHQKENLHTANGIACLPITNEWLLASNDMQITDGMKLASQQNGILEYCAVRAKCAFAMWSCSLRRRVCYFEVRVIQNKFEIFVGLSDSAFPLSGRGIALSSNTFVLNSSGERWIQGYASGLVKEFDAKDVVGCGVEIDEQQQRAMLFFTKNGQLNGNPIPLPDCAIGVELFPTVIMWGKGNECEAIFDSGKFLYDLGKHKLADAQQQ